MRVLLDTLTFLWWITDDPRLSTSDRAVVSDPGNELFISAASGWEMAIKVRLGRLQVAGDLTRVIPEHMASNHRLQPAGSHAVSRTCRTFGNRCGGKRASPFRL